MKKITASFIITLAVLPLPLCADTRVESTIDWSSGQFSISATRTLDSGMSPDDHPRALALMERELPPLVVDAFEQLAWDRLGSLENHLVMNPSLRTSVEILADTLTREWSRISADRKSIEASYTVELSAVLPELFPLSANEGISPIPIGWVPIPEDPWTGIVIYVPDSLPLRGTGLSSSLRPAIYARVLSDNLEVLADPATGIGTFLRYRSLESREGAENINGRRPYRVMARELYGEYPCDIILNEEDSRRILAADSGRQALADGRIIILLESIPD